MPNPTIDLRQYWNVLRSRKLWVIIPVLLAAGLAILYTRAQAPSYAAQATVRVDPLVNPLTAAGSKASQPDMATEQQTGASVPVAAVARGLLHTQASTDSLLGGLKVQAASSGNVLVFTYTSRSAATAVRDANAFAQAYLSYRASSVTAPLDRLIKQRRAAIAALTSHLRKVQPTASQTVLHLLTSQLNLNQADLIRLQDSRQLVWPGTVLSTATPPASRSAPKLVRTLVIAVVAGLVAGIFLALLREGMDGRIKGRAELEARLRAPVLGIIPKARRQLPGEPPILITDPRGSASEAYRMAAATLQHLAAQDGRQVIMVTSPLSGGARTAATANLGVALAEAGQRVVLVAADLRAPTLQLAFGLPDGPGLTSAVLDGRDLQPLIQETPVPGLDILPGGLEPDNPAGLLASTAAGETFAALRALRPDLILVDVPAVLAASDALMLAPRVDGAVVVWHGKDSPATAVTEARDRLAAAGTAVLGGIYSFHAGWRPGRRPARRHAGGPGSDVLSELTREPPEPAASEGPAEAQLSAAQPEPGRDPGQVW